MIDGRKVVTVLVVVALTVFSTSMITFGTAREQETERIQALETQLKDNPKDTKILMDLGLIYHSKAVEGDRQAIQKAEQIFKEILKAEPDNAEAHA